MKLAFTLAGKFNYLGSAGNSGNGGIWPQFTYVIASLNWSQSLAKLIYIHEFAYFPYCRLYHPMGTIHDGWGNYSVSVKCSWLIDAHHPHYGRRHSSNPSRAANIRIHLREFATECGWDHLYIYDGDSVDSPLLAVFRYVLCTNCSSNGPTGHSLMLILNRSSFVFCSGLMYRGNFSIRRVPQVIARSGTALLHFFSDDAYNMSGFNLTYKMNGCPTDSDGK